ncbi:MAG: hypothetical protein LBL69_03360, partial [Zoogloeaceae bacterium]|nr:hypothetical protein [Zoogloeaceae bacterium]
EDGKLLISQLKDLAAVAMKNSTGEDLVKNDDIGNSDLTANINDLAANTNNLNDLLAKKLNQIPKAG